MFDVGVVVDTRVGEVGHARGGLVVGADAVGIGSGPWRRKNRGCRCIGWVAFVGDGPFQGCRFLGIRIAVVPRCCCSFGLPVCAISIMEVRGGVG